MLSWSLISFVCCIQRARNWNAMLDCLVNCFCWDQKWNSWLDQYWVNWGQGPATGRLKLKRLQKVTVYWPSAMNEQKTSEMSEFWYSMITCQNCGHSFTTSNTNSNLGNLQHTHILRSISDSQTYSFTLISDLPRYLRIERVDFPSGPISYLRFE